MSKQELSCQKYDSIISKKNLISENLSYKGFFKGTTHFVNILGIFRNLRIWSKLWGIVFQNFVDRIEPWLAVVYLYCFQQSTTNPGPNLFCPLRNAIEKIQLFLDCIFAESHSLFLSHTKLGQKVVFVI